MPIGPAARRSRFAGFALVLVVAAGLGAPEAPLADEFVPVDEFVGDDGLTGDAIYERVLDNRFDAFEQYLRLRSAAPSGRFSEVELRLRYRSYREESDRILSKTIAKYFEPGDVRHLGYLVINKRSGPDDQFVYRPSARKVRRVNVRGESIAGTDFSFEDVVPPEFEDGAHYRMPDETIAGLPVYVVVVVPSPETESEYAKLVFYVDQSRFVPIRTLYWDNKRILIKQLDADVESIEAREARYQGRPKTIHVALRSRMTHLKLGSHTDLVIDEFEADPTLRSRHFSERELTASH